MLKKESAISVIYLPMILAGYVRAGVFIPTSDFNRLQEVDNIIITVPTPLNEHREPDLGFVENTSRVIAANLQKGQLVVLESTTYPGTSRCNLAAVGKDGDEGWTRLFSGLFPERVDPNNKNYKAKEIPKVVGGITASCLERAMELYGKVFEQLVPVSSVKLLRPAN